MKVFFFKPCLKCLNYQSISLLPLKGSPRWWLWPSQHDHAHTFGYFLVTHISKMSMKEAENIIYLRHSSQNGPCIFFTVLCWLTSQTGYLGLPVERTSFQWVNERVNLEDKLQGWFPNILRTFQWVKYHAATLLATKFIFENHKV